MRRAARYRDRLSVARDFNGRPFKSPISQDDLAALLEDPPEPECDGCGNTPAAPTCPHTVQCRDCGPVLTGCWECKRDERSEG